MPIETIATEPPVFVRKKKGMKRFKGLITGKSRKEKRNARAEAKRVPGDASVTPYTDIGDDTSTVYGAHMDSTVVTSVLPEPSLIADPVQVVLLVMDPATRRFELLQLEFDSTMAKVSDIYKQIPTAATEAVLQSALYKAIVTAKGEVWKSDDLLAHNVDGAAVVIAVREDDAETINKLVNMAVPILTNKKVRKMVSLYSFPCFYPILSHLYNQLKMCCCPFFTVNQFWYKTRRSSSKTTIKDEITTLSPNYRESWSKI